VGRTVTAPTIEAERTWAVMQGVSTRGDWTEEDYLALTTNRLVEYSRGTLEVLPMPSERHQDLVFFLAQLLAAFVRRHQLGKVTIAPLPVQLWPGEFREPDIQFMRSEHAARRRRSHWIGADLVVEVLSPDDRRRDLETKRDEYAQAAIPEYWIVDPEAQRITVLTLAGAEYAVHGEFGADEQATSPLLPGFAVDVAALFAAAEGSQAP